MAKTEINDYSSHKYFENREISWLKFNERVLSEAEDDDNPLFERLKFLSISASNLDEFIMVRIASLINMLHSGYDGKDIAGLTTQNQLRLLGVKVHDFMEKQYSVYNQKLLPLLLENGLKIVEHFEDLNEEEALFVDKFFETEVYPVLTPMAVDSSRPFPLIRNKTLNIGALIDKKNDEKEELVFATVQVPSVLPRIVELPHVYDGPYKVILLEEIIEKNLSKLFLNYDIVCSYPFRIMRNADFSLDEDEADDLLLEIERQIRKRQWGEVTRLEIEKGMDKRLLEVLCKSLEIREGSVFSINGPLDLTFLMKMYSMPGYEGLKEHSYISGQQYPLLPSGCDIFNRIREKDMLLFHPYQTFEPIIYFVQTAAKDPQVLAIKQTLYRVSGNSPIIAALAQAAENGKQVTVLVELKARFDEENNIIWAKRLEQAGCHVIYGLVGLKTHSKITLVVRKEEDGIRRYVHLGTGNYNDSTAKLYTDVGFLTAEEAIGEDATAVFNMLSGYSEPVNWNRLSLAPLWLKDKFLELINREKEHALVGEKAKIIAKMNSVCDPDIIKALYQAAAAGVKIDLIVRGICCIKLDVPGIKNNLRVRSIVGNFLEHARIFYFENAGKSEVYCSSADWMPRNLERRVEILFPVSDETSKEKLIKILKTQLADNQKAHLLTSDGKYVRVKDIENGSEEEINSQLEFGKEAMEAVNYLKASGQSRVFIPEVNPNINE